MSEIEAVYRNGVFKPLADVELGLHENQRVRLHVEPIQAATSRAWLEDVRQLQRAILDRRGPLPDSAQTIAADRSREI